MIQKAQKSPKRVVFPEGEEDNIINAAYSLQRDNIAVPVLIGNRNKIIEKMKGFGYETNGFEIYDPNNFPGIEKYLHELYSARQRKGFSLRVSKQLIKEPIYFASVMLRLGEVDALISGTTTYYHQTIRPALQVVGVKEGFKVVSGIYIIITKNDVFFFADTTVNINPTAEELAEIAISTADTVTRFDIEPRVAMLSFSNFGSVVSLETLKVKKAVEIVKRIRPDIIIDGEMQADTAVVSSILENEFPFSDLKSKANVLVFPDLNSGNIAYKLMARIGEASVIGPVLTGMKKPVHVLQKNASVDDIINMAAIAVVEADYNSNSK